MVKVKIAGYMIDKEDEIESDDTYIIVEVEYKEKIYNIIEEVSDVLPCTVKGWIDGNKKIKKNLIIVLNDKIVNKQKMDSYNVSEDDTLEFLTQFAGG